MKKIPLQLVKLALAGICISGAVNGAYAQGRGQVGIGTVTPDSSAALDVQSDSLGFLPPRLTTLQRNAINGPAKGLLIYNTTTGIVEINIGTAAAPIWTTATGGIQTVRTQTASLTGAGPAATINDNTGLLTLANSSPAPTGAVAVNAPANATTGQLLTINNNTGLTANYAGIAIPAGGGRQFVYNGTAWVPINTTATTVATASATQAVSGASPTQQLPSGAEYVNITGSPTGTVTLTPPASIVPGQVITVTNNTSAPATFTGTSPATSLPVGATQQYVYTGTTWMPVGSAGPSGVNAANPTASGANPTTAAPASGTTYINVTGSPTGTVTITPPTAPVAGQVVNVTNGTGVPATYAGNTIAAGGGGSYIYNGTAWVPTTGPNFYNNDGALGGNRTVNTGANNLTFSSATTGTYVRVEGADKRSLQVTSTGVSTSIFGTDGSTAVLGADIGAVDIRTGMSNATLGGTSRIFAGTNGNVGIGTNAPSQKLDVNGNAYVNGIIKQTFADGDKLQLVGIGTASRISHASPYAVQYFAGNKANASTGMHQWFTVDANANETQKMSLDNAGNLLAQGWMQGTVFYDKDNTGYYCDPAGGIALNGAGEVRGNLFRDQNDANFYADPNGNSRMNRVDYSFGYDIDNTNYYLDLNNTSRMYSVNSDNLISPIFFDRDNTAFYCDPAGGIALNGVGEVRGNLFRDNDDGNYYLNPNDGGNSLVMAGRAIGAGFTGSGESYGSAWRSAPGSPYYLNPGDGNVSLNAAGAVTANAFIDRDNTAFYLDPTGNSSLNALTVTNNISNQASIFSKTFYDIDNTGYYVDPASDSRFNNVRIVGGGYGAGELGGNGPGAYNAGDDAIWHNAYFSGGFGLAASAGITCDHLQVKSDSRLKNIKNISDSKTDLDKMMSVKIYDYTMKDYHHYHNRPFKKVVAQQVDSVFAQAVYQSEDFIPNIYSFMKAENGWLLTNTDTFKVGNEISYASKTGSLLENKILAVDGKRIKVAEVEGRDSVFVFGTKVPDLMQVDYEALSTLSISATQEIYKQLQAEQKKVKALEAGQQKMAALEAKNVQLEAKVAALEAKEQELTDLKTAMAELRSELSKIVLNKVAKGKVAAK